MLETTKNPKRNYPKLKKSPKFVINGASSSQHTQRRVQQGLLASAAELAGERCGKRCVELNAAAS